MSYVWRIRITRNQGWRRVVGETDWMLGIPRKHTSSSKWSHYFDFIHIYVLKSFLESFQFLQTLMLTLTDYENGKPLNHLGLGFEMLSSL